MTRKLATVRRIAEIKEIEGVDRIVAYRVDGWWVVGKKGEWSIGDLVIYLEIDSWVPNEIAPFLTKEGKEPKEFNGIKGEKLKTIKLKGQLSQGLLLSIETAYPYIPEEDESFIYDAEELHIDLSPMFNIQLWEQPVKLNKHGQPIENRSARKGGFPIDIPKSDQERIQNCTKLFNKFKELSWEITEKLDGSSMTVYINGEDEGVCSRNINLKGPHHFENDTFEPNSFWRVVLRDNILNKIRSIGRNLAFQGELIGPGIQGNIYKLSDHQFYLYNIWDIDNQSWLTPNERFELTLLHNININHVPVLATNYIFKENESIDSLLELSEGKSVLNTLVEREGLVFKSNYSSDSFKVISNKYLLN